MSRLDELIAELCPNGVKQFKIADLTNYEQPSKYIVKSTDYNDSFETPVLTAGQTFILGYTNEIDGIYNASKENPVIIFDDFTGALKWVDFSFKVKSSAMKLITANEKILIRYLYHVMSNIGLTSDEHKRLWISVYAEQTIPLPPLPVQEEIVRILDNFTELTAELTARKTQYEYYRDSLLTFGDEVEYKKIKNIFTRIKGTPITAGKMKEIESLDGDIRIFAGGKTVINAFEEDIPNANITRVPAVLVQSRGVIDAIFYEEPFTFKNEMWAYTAENRTSVKYLYYVLKNSIQQFRDAASGMGSMPQISLKVTEEFVIPFPSLDEQARIVEILDKFDVLTTDISTGLPAEIEARQKQYGYYRDKLLTFQELS